MGKSAVLLIFAILVLVYCLNRNNITASVPLVLVDVDSNVGDGIINKKLQVIEEEGRVIRNSSSLTGQLVISNQNQKLREDCCIDDCDCCIVDDCDCCEGCSDYDDGEACPICCRNRLMRNRENAQLSRQRKKHYVEELQDKVKSMSAAIQDLNTQIAYVMSENAILRQQLSGRVPPPPGLPPPPRMYPPHMMYTWMPYGVPLVPIPRLKSQQPASASKASKKPESKKAEMKPERKKVEMKTKQVASVSFLGLLFFLFLFGGLVPMVNLRYEGIDETVSGVTNIGESYYYQKHHERALSTSRHVNGKKANLKLNMKKNEEQNKKKDAEIATNKRGREEKERKEKERKKKLMEEERELMEEAKSQRSEVAEAVRRQQEKKDQERKLRKKAMQEERARVEQENWRLMKLNMKKNEEQKKKKDAEIVSKKKWREEEERKGKERKRKLTKEAKSQLLEEGKFVGDKVDEEQLPITDGYNKKNDANNGFQKHKDSFMKSKDHITFEKHATKLTVSGPTSDVQHASLSFDVCGTSGDSLDDVKVKILLFKI